MGNKRQMTWMGYTLGKKEIVKTCMCSARKSSKKYKWMCYHCLPFKLIEIFSSYDTQWAQSYNETDYWRNSERLENWWSKYNPQKRNKIKSKWEFKWMRKILPFFFFSCFNLHKISYTFKITSVTAGKTFLLRSWQKVRTLSKMFGVCAGRSLVIIMANTNNCSSLWLCLNQLPANMESEIAAMASLLCLSPVFVSVHTFVFSIIKPLVHTLLFPGRIKKEILHGFTTTVFWEVTCFPAVSFL